MACGSTNNKKPFSHAQLYLGYIIYQFGAENHPVFSVVSMQN